MPHLYLVLAKKVVTPQAPLELTHYDSGVNVQPLGKPQHSLLFEEWRYTRNETVDFLLCNAKVCCRLVGHSFLLIELVAFRSFDILIEDVAIFLAVALKDVLKLMAQNKPKVVDPV